MQHAAIADATPPKYHFPTLLKDFVEFLTWTADVSAVAGGDTVTVADISFIHTFTALLLLI